MYTFFSDINEIGILHNVVRSLRFCSLIEQVVSKAAKCDASNVSPYRKVVQVFFIKDCNTKF